MELICFTWVFLREIPSTKFVALILLKPDGKEFQHVRMNLKDGNRKYASSACSECNVNGKMNVRTNVNDGLNNFQGWVYDNLQ